jgi:multidrug efflux pump subunit AcrA (membrane-fusion protein)
VNRHAARMSAALAAGWPATLEWARRVELGVPVSGVVQEVTVAPGQRVAAGTVLV